MAYVIRPYRDDDAEVLAEILASAITDIGPHAYSPAQVAAWAARHPGARRYRERVAAGDVIFVAADVDDRPVAYVLLEQDGHIDHLYNHPEHTRRGLATQLLATAATYARKHGRERLYAEASDLARPAFERAGFAASHKREFTIPHGDRDVPIHNWGMEKPLS